MSSFILSNINILSDFENFRENLLWGETNLHSYASFKSFKTWLDESF